MPLTGMCSNVRLQWIEKSADFDESAHKACYIIGLAGA
jgi:hypothetical protein